MNKFKRFIFCVSEKLFSGTLQAKLLIIIFGLIGIISLIGSYWNPSQLLLTAMCLLMIFCGLKELKDENKR